MVEEGRLLEINGKFKWLSAFSRSINKTGGEISSKYYGFKRIYVDSKNLLHCLNGPAWIDKYCKYYFIHGKLYSKKQWLIKREELLLEQHRLDILEEL